MSWSGPHEKWPSHALTPTVGHLEAVVCLQNLLPGGFFPDGREQFGITWNPGLLA